MITPTNLSLALGVNGSVVCDCGETKFEVGLAVNPDNFNNFVRVLECVSCGRQLSVVHRSDEGLVPVLEGGAWHDG